MNVTFTGTRRGMTPAQQEQVEFVLSVLSPARVHHGACVGADREFHTLVNGSLRVLHPTSQEQAEWAMANIGPGDEVRTIDSDPLHRNHTMVNAGHALIAAPGGNREILRSGTWATIRYAKKAGILIYLCYPDGRTGVIKTSGEKLL